MYTHEQLKRKVIKWSSDRGIDRYENHPKQIMKLMEETGELCAHVNSGYFGDGC